MKSAAYLLSALAVLALIAGSAEAVSLDRAGTWIPSVFNQSDGPRGTRGLINDGSFEQGPPPASAWTEVSNSPNCEWIGDFAEQWYISAWHGFMEYWAGGYCTDDQEVPFTVTSSVTQTIHVPEDSTALSFYYVSLRLDPDDTPPDGDHAYVAVNGLEVWTMDLIQANDTYPLWTGPIKLNLSPYGGQDISLSFGGISEGEITGNILFDYIEWITVTTAEDPTLTVRTSLGPITPNPFSDRTAIRFNVAATCPVRLQVFDLRGRLVSTLVDQPMTSGIYSVNFSPSKLASGVYLCRLQAGAETIARRVLVFR